MKPSTVSAGPAASSLWKTSTSRPTSTISSSSSAASTSTPKTSSGDSTIWAGPRATLAGARAFSRRALRRLRFQCERRSGLVRLCRVSTSRPAMFRVFALVALAGVFAVADESPSCPAKCMCFRSTVRCMHLHLQTIPDAPTNTSVL
ncbi:unnamed protein product, partial [Nesidiocoris tenuis]